VAKNPITSNFTFDVDGIPRCVFNATETADGSIILNLLPKGDPQFKRFGGVPGSEPSALRASRISIHTSDKSDEKQENFIKLTHVPEVGEKITSVICTTAIKKWSAFSPVFSRRFDDIRAPCYDVSDSARPTMTLSPATLTLTPAVSVFAGPVGRKFELTPVNYLQSKVQYKQLEFSRLSLMFMWSFILLAPKEVYDLHMQTTPKTGPVSFGVDIECLAFYIMERDELKNNLVERWRATGDLNAVRAIEMAKLVGYYFREARTDTEEFKEFSRKLNASGIMSRPLGYPQFQR
jgi:hypothetical protein